MKKLTILHLADVDPNDNPVVIYDPEEIKEAIYDNEIAYLTKEDRELFEKEFGFRPENYEKIKRESDEEELDDRVREFLDEHGKYPEQICQGYYCSDIYEKEELEEIVKNGGLLYWNVLEYPTEEADFDYDKYYTYWDGSNWRALKIDDIEEVEVEEDYDVERGNTWTRYFYTTKDGKRLVVFSSHYQGTLDELEEDYEALEEK